MTERHDPEIEGLLEDLRRQWRPASTDPASFDERLHRRIRRRWARNTAVAATLAVAASVALVFVVRGWQAAPGAAPGDGEPTLFAEAVTESPEGPTASTATATTATEVADTLPAGWQLAVSEEPSSMDLPDEYDALSQLFLGGGLGGGS